MTTLRRASEEAQNPPPLRADPASASSGKAKHAGARRVGRLRQLWQAVTGRKPGLTVVLLGPDGSGKSTLAAGLERLSPLPVRTVYMGLWKDDSRSFQRRPLPGWSLGRRLLWAWRQYLVGQWHRRQGRLVIFDRYTFDALLGVPAARGNKDRLYLWLLGHSCPAPDLVFVLDISGEEMFQRKGESSPEELEGQRQGYLALRERIPRLRVIDASRTQAAVETEITERIWDHYLGRD